MGRRALLAGDAPGLELPDVEQAEGDPSAVAGDSEELAGDRSGAQLLRAMAR
jgi:hypothetical protein